MSYLNDSKNISSYKVRQREKHCPVCGSIHTHIMSVRIYPWKGQNILLLIDSDGLKFQEKNFDFVNGVGSRRGSTVEIKFMCEECSHSFVESATFHKGIVYEDVIDTGEESCGFEDELWRD